MTDLTLKLVSCCYKTLLDEYCYSSILTGLFVVIRHRDKKASFVVIRPLDKIASGYRFVIR